jgi:stage V sporulation protein B
MVFPIITFPAVLFSSVSELIVPELTEEQVKGRNDRISMTANLLLKLCFVFSAGVMGALFCFSDELGMSIYDSTQVGQYIRILSALMPVMYMDSVTDGMLRGLGQQLYSMRINIIDSLLSTALIYFLLPRYAVNGYIFVLYASEIFNFYFSMRKLAEITDIKQSVKSMLMSLAAVFCAANFTRLFVNVAATASEILTIVTGTLIFMGLYFLLLTLFGALDNKELRAILSVLK